MNLNQGQVLSIIIGILGVWVASATQLTDLVGPAITKIIIAASTLTMSSLAVVNTILQGQGSQIAAVQSMPGVEKIIVNSQANATLATLAVDPTQAKIEATPQATAAVQRTAAAAA